MDLTRDFIIIGTLNKSTSQNILIFNNNNNNNNNTKYGERGRVLSKSKTSCQLIRPRLDDVSKFEVIECIEYS